MEIVRERVIEYTATVPVDLDGFKAWEFTSGCTTGKDFKQFARVYKKFVKASLPEGAVLAQFSAGHYDLFGFVERDGKFVYFSTDDARHFKNGWAENILVRTAKGVKDYGGGSNIWTNLQNFKADVERLLEA